MKNSLQHLPTLQTMLPKTLPQTSVATNNKCVLFIQLESGTAQRLSLCDSPGLSWPLLSAWEQIASSLECLSGLHLAGATHLSRSHFPCLSHPPSRFPQTCSSLRGSSKPISSPGNRQQKEREWEECHGKNEALQPFCNLFHQRAFYYFYLSASCFHFKNS